MKGMACAAYGVFLGLFLAASVPAFAGEAPGDIVTITGKVLGHVIAGEDNNLYETVPSPRSEALMDLSGKRVSVTGMLLNDCDWTCLMDVTGFSVLTDQTTPPPPPAPVFVPAKKLTPILPPPGDTPRAVPPAFLPEKAQAPVEEPQLEATPAEPEGKAAQAVEPADTVVTAPAVAAPVVTTPSAPEAALPAGDPAGFRAR